jgi:hypothetical protein
MAREAGASDDPKAFDKTFKRVAVKSKARKAMAADRSKRLQLLLAPDELVEIDDFRFGERLPTRAAAVRELLRRGLLEAKAEKPGTKPGPRKKRRP